GAQLEQYAAFSVELGPITVDLTPDQAWRLAAERNGVSHYQERYIYQDGRLARIEVRHAWGGELFAHEELVSYDKLGRVQTIEATYADGSPQTIYRRPEPSYGVGTPAGRIYQRLLEAVPRRLARAKVRDKVYCLALLYTAGSVQPRLALGFEKTRADLARKRGGAGLISALWQPNDAVVELDDPALESDRAIFEQQ